MENGRRRDPEPGGRKTDIGSWEVSLIKGPGKRAKVLTVIIKITMLKLLDAEVVSGWNKTRLAASVVKTMTQTPMTWIGLYNEETVNLFEEIMGLETGGSWMLLKMALPLEGWF